MNDVFDEDLMRELGLDPDEIEAVKSPKPAPKAPAPQPKAESAEGTTSPTPKAPAPRAQQPQAAKPAAPKPAAPVRPAPKAPSKLETSFSTEVDLPLDDKEQISQTQEPQDLSAYGEKMTQGIPVHLAAVIAKKSVALKDIVEMRTGEVIDFKKLPQDPIDLVVNGKLVAKAELVLVDGRVGARIVKLIR